MPYKRSHKMRPNTAKRTNASSKDKVRKSLRDLQPSATDKENLVGSGRTLRSSQQFKDAKNKIDVLEKTKNHIPKRKIGAFKDETVQTETDKPQITVEDLTNPAGPSENYWEVIAKRRRIALEDTLNENKELTERIKQLEEEKKLYQIMLDETRALVEVLQDMIGDDSNGINNSLED